MRTLRLISVRGFRESPFPRPWPRRWSGPHSFRHGLVTGVLLLGLSGCATAPIERATSSRVVIAESRAEANQTGLSDLAIHAIGLVGVPYKWGGNTPAGGFDCSGLVVYVAYRAKGLKLPRTVVEMSRFGQETDVDQRLPGDLIFFNTTGHPFSHVGIYVGKNRFVHAPNEGGTVRIESLLSSYWAPRLTTIRRLPRS